VGKKKGETIKGHSDEYTVVGIFPTRKRGAKKGECALKKERESAPVEELADKERKNLSFA